MKIPHGFKYSKLEAVRFFVVRSLYKVTAIPVSFFFTDYFETRSMLLQISGYDKERVPHKNRLYTARIPIVPRTTGMRPKPRRAMPNADTAPITPNRMLPSWT